MNPLLQQAEELLKLGQNTDKRGMYYLAGLRYAQVFTTLFNIGILKDSGTVPLSSSEEANLASLHERLALTKNGHQLSWKTKDTPDSAIETLLEEVMAGF